jgi:hypothetical protein
MSWQEIQARDPSTDKRGSANRRSPKASFKESAEGGGGTGVIGSCSVGPCCPRICDSGAAATVTVRTRNNTRHPRALRHKFEPVGAPSNGILRAQGICHLSPGHSLSKRIALSDSSCEREIAPIVRYSMVSALRNRVTIVARRALRASRLAEQTRSRRRALFE